MPRSARLPPLLILVALLFATVLAYLPGLRGDFVFDDFPNILDNQRLVLHDLKPASLREVAFSSQSGLLDRPISMLSFAFNIYFFGPHPYSFKIVNLIIHLLNGVAIYLLARRLLNAVRPDPGSPPPTRFPSVTGAALLLAGLWLLQPLNLTAVLYVVQRMTSLASLFMLAGMILYTTGRLRQRAARRGWPWLSSAYVFCLPLALLCKEIGALLPLYLLVIEFCVFRFCNRSGAMDKGIIALFVVTVALPGLAALGALIAHPEIWLSYHGRDFTLTERLLTESRAVLFYLRMLLMPDLTQLGLYHDDFGLSRGLLTPPMTLVSLIVHAFLIGLAFTLRRARPLLALGILWFYAGHVLESTILPLELLHEHRNYLPSVGILLALIDVGAVLTARLTPRRQQLIGAICITLFGVVTALRASQWADNVTQAEYEARHHPDSARAENSLGRIYGKLALSGQAGYAEQAYRVLGKAMALESDDCLPAALRILVRAGLHHPVPSEWITALESRLQHGLPSPAMVNSLYELKRCQATACRLSLAAPTMHDFFEAALANPRMAHAGQVHADVLTQYGNYMMNNEHNMPAALAPFRAAVATAPDVPQYRINLIKLLIALGRADEARVELVTLRKMDRLGQYSREIATFKMELESSPSPHSD